MIDQRVFDILNEFYTISRKVHISMSYEECVRKIDRLEKAMKAFAQYAEFFHKEPYRKDWKELGYSEFITEDLHFAYRIS